MSQIGLVKEIFGVVQAVAADGSIRVLVLGDVINQGEVIITVGSDSSVKLSFDNGKELVLSGDEKSLMDDSVVSSEVVADSDVTAGQQALLDGGDLPTEAPAAGADGPEGTGGITEAYIAERSDGRGDVASSNRGTERSDGRGDVDSYNLGTARLLNDNPDGNQNDQINQAPVATDDAGIVNEGVSLFGNILANDTDDGLPNPDADLDIVSVNGVTPDADGNIIITTEFGTLILNAETGAYTYTIDDNNPTVDALNIGGNLTETFTYTVTDGDKIDNANLTITINGSNDAPIAVNDRTGVTVVQGEIVSKSTYSDGGDGQDYNEVPGVSIDAWSFTHNGGPLNIDILTERGNGSWTDIDNDGNQSNLDSMIHVYSVNSNGVRTTYLASDDDGGLGNDGSTHGYDSFLNLGNLPAGNYVIEISDYVFEESEIGQTSQDASSLDNNTGAYQITFDGDVTITSVPELGKIVSQGNSTSSGNNAIEEGTAGAEGDYDIAVAATGNVLDNDTDVDNPHSGSD